MGSFIYSHFQRISEFIEFIILDRLLIEERTLTTLQMTWLDGFPHCSNQVFTRRTIQ